MIDRYKGHYPGPWHYRVKEESDWGDINAFSPRGRMGVLCHVNAAFHQNTKGDPCKATGHLVADAPLLLGALTMASQKIEEISGDCPLGMEERGWECCENDCSNDIDQVATCWFRYFMQAASEEEEK